MLTQSHPYFFAPGHAELEATACTFRTSGSVRERVAALGAAGLLAQRDTRSLAVIRRHLAYQDPLTDLSFIIQELGCVPLERSGKFPEVVAAARRGERIVVFGLTEPNAGSDVRGIQTVAEADVSGGADAYRLSGEKCFISNAPVADFAVVFAKLGGSVAAFFVETPVTAAQDVAAHSIGRIYLNDTPATLLSTKGFALAFQTLERARPSVGAAAVGIAARAVDETVAHLKQREQFGAPLANLPVVRHRLAEMAIELEVATLATLHACWKRDSAGPNDRTGYTSAVGKVVATESAQRIVDQAVQLHGARGVEVGSVIEGLYRAIRPLRIYEGATDVLHTVIAEHWLGPAA